MEGWVYRTDGERAREGEAFVQKFSYQVSGRLKHRVGEELDEV